MEDVQLCTLWLKVTQDPIVGVNQIGNSFWNYVTNKYTQQRKNEIHHELLLT